MPVRGRQKAKKGEVVTMNENSLRNLRPYDRERAKKYGRRGGVASVIAKKKKKSLRELAAGFLNMECNDEMKKKLRDLGIAEEDFTNGMAVIYGLYASALRGHVGAVRLILELTGELKQQNAVTVNTNVNPYANLTEDELRILAGVE